MQITDEIKKNILDRTDIVDLIAEVVELQKRGRNYIGLCPFHNEKTPSFNVSNDKKIYKCFGCGKSGNAITFMIDFHGLSFPEAVKELGRRTGITIPENNYSNSADIPKELSKKDQMLIVLDKAANYFHKALLSSPGKIALEYYENRGFTPETINLFLLGYSYDTWDSLKKEFLKQDFDEEILLDSGLIIMKEDNKNTYDRFRNRAIFPIQDYLGRVVGFGARQLNEDKSQPKYINSPQTLVYDKSKLLYGLFHAKNEIRNKKNAILVEGYADVISLHQAGIKNVIASSGTALTIEQVEIISKYCKTLYIVYDADEAGIKAADRAIEIVIEHGLEAKIVKLPKGEDPDSIISNFGLKLFESHLNDATNFIDFKLNYYKELNILNSPADMVEAIRNLISIIVKIPDSLQHDFYINRIAMKLNLSESQINKIYKEKNQLKEKYKHKKFNVLNKNTQNNEFNSSTILEEEIQKKQSKAEFQKQVSQILPEEVLILQTILNYPDALKIIKYTFKLKPENFVSSLAQDSFKIILYFADSSDDIIKYLADTNDIETNIKEYLIELSFNELHISENWKSYDPRTFQKDIQRIVRDSLARLEIRRIEIEISKMQNKISETPDMEEQLDLMRKVKDLNDKLLKIKRIITNDK